MTYFVKGIDRIVWKLAKSNWSKYSYKQLINKFNELASEFLGQETHLSEVQIISIVGDAFGNYCANCTINSLAIRDMYVRIYGDPVIAMVYGVDKRSIGQRCIEETLQVIRHSQIRKDNEILIDWENDE